MLTDYEKDLLRWILKILTRFESYQLSEDRVEKIKQAKAVISKLL